MHDTIKSILRICEISDLKPANRYKRIRMKRPIQDEKRGQGNAHCRNCDYTWGFCILAFARGGDLFG